MSSGKIKIYCRHCGAELTVPVTELLDLTRLNETDGSEHIPAGYYCFSNGEFYINTVGDIIVNMRDVVNLGNHPDLHRLNGCCGLDGCDGPNKVCPDGHEVATEKSDCWMPHAVLFHLKDVEMK